MAGKNIEVSPSTYNNFVKLKETIEATSGEKVTDDEVVDFMIRAILESIELPEDEDEDSSDHHCHCGHCHHS